MAENQSQSAWEFDRDVGVERIGPGRLCGEITERWNIGIAPNGGYLASVALAALRASVARPGPVAVSAQFPSRAEPGPVDIDVDVLREGGHSFAMARMVQDEHTRVLVAATFG